MATLKIIKVIKKTEEVEDQNGEPTGEVRASLHVDLELDGVPYDVAVDAEGIETKADLRKRLKPWAKGMLADPHAKRNVSTELGGDEFTV